MSFKSVLTQDDRLELAGDGGLFTAAAFAALTSVGFGLMLLDGGSAGGFTGGALAFLEWLLTVAGFVVGPYLAWRLHARRIDKFAFGGAVTGWVVASAIVGGCVMLVAGLSSLLDMVLPGEFTGPLVMLAIVAGAFLVVVIWLLASAVRDLAGAREHTVLDIWRLVATLAIIAFAVGVALYQRAKPEVDVAEAAIFMLVGGIFGGVGIFVADIITGALNPGSSAETPAQA